MREDISKEECRGVYWKAVVSNYISSSGDIVVKKMLRLLKRKSCPGCIKCGWLMEYIAEDIGNLDLPDYIGEVENGKIYTYRVDTSQGYHDLYPEIECIEFVEVEKEKK